MEEFVEVCRICSNSSNSLMPLTSIIHQNLSSKEIFNSTLCSKIIDDDKLPQNICTLCIEDLIKIYDFHQKYELTQRKLKEFYTTNTRDNLDVRLIYTKEVDKVEIEDTKLYLSEKIEENIYLSDCEDNISNNGSISEYLKLENRHSDIKDNAQRFYKCVKCKVMFDSENELVKHREDTQHKDVRNHTCEICKKKFTRSKLKQHMRVHTQERPYNCNMCSLSFSISGNLKRHMMTHTGEKPHICEVCGKGFIQACALQRHQRTHKGTTGSQGKNNGEPSFDCTICGRQFKRFARYQTHLTKHSIISKPNIIKNGKIDIKADSNIRKEMTQTYTCDICDNSYRTKVILKAHYLTHGGKSFLCSQCGKGFVTKSALQSHLLVHTGERPHTCAICKKAFAHIGTFEKHVLTHTGEKPYVCQICGKSFSQYSHMKHHLRTHTGERPHVCPFCAKAFASKGNLTVHVRIHTGETPYLCPVCGRGYYDSTSMKRHWKGHDDYKAH